jgi:hypothetical protein
MNGRADRDGSLDSREVTEQGNLVLFPCSRAAASITVIAAPVEGGWTASRTERGKT